MILEFLLPFIILSVVYRLFRARYPRGFPPGPAWKLPILGNILDITRPDMLSGLDKLRRKHGDICGFYYGQTLAVLVSNRDLIKKIAVESALNQKKFVYGLAKMQGYVTNGKQKEMAGILHSANANWREQRNFMMSALKSLGKTTLQGKAATEAEMLCDQLRAYNGRPVDVLSQFRLSSLNSFWLHVIGKRVKDDDTKAIEALKMGHKAGSLFANPFGQMVVKSKLLFHLVKKLICPTYFDCVVKRANYVKQQITEHEKTFSKDHIRDLTDVFIERTRSEQNQLSSFYGENGKANLVATIMNLLSAGDTMNATLTWSVLYMALNPNVQAKVQEELDGLDRDVMYPEDQAFLPYTSASIHEVMRIASIVPQISRVAGKDTRIGDCTIQKGTRIIFNYYHNNRNPDVFHDATVFKPERFINPHGQFVPHTSILPFGYGKRRCLGESISKIILYTFFTRILKKFIICKQHPNDYLSEKPVFATVSPPNPFKVNFIERKKY